MTTKPGPDKGPKYHCGWKFLNNSYAHLWFRTTDLKDAGIRDK